MGDMFLKVEGISGESLDGQHENEIEIFSWKWNVDNTAAMEQSSAHGATKLNAADIEVTKTVDKASLALMKYCAHGTPTTAKITCRKNNGETKLEFLIIELMDVKIKKLDWSGRGEAQDAFVPEVVTLNFGKFRVSYKEQGNSGAAIGTTSYGYNISQHQEMS